MSLESKALEQLRQLLASDELSSQAAMQLVMSLMLSHYAELERLQEELEEGDKAMRDQLNVYDQKRTDQMTNLGKVLDEFRTDIILQVGGLSDRIAHLEEDWSSNPSIIKQLKTNPVKTAGWIVTVVLLVIIVWQSELRNTLLGLWQGDPSALPTPSILLYLLRL